MARPTPVAAVPSAPTPGAELDALDRAAEGIRPSWHGAAPASAPPAAPIPPAPLPAVPQAAGLLPPVVPELSSSISGVQPSPLVQPVAPAPISDVVAPQAATPSAAPLASEVALYYGSDPAPRSADSTQPMPPILLPSPWAQFTRHPLVERLLELRAQHPRAALAAGAALALLLLIAIWPSSSAPLPPPPLPAAPQAKQTPPVDAPAPAAEAAAPEAHATAPVAAPAKSARKTTKRPAPARPVAAKPVSAKPAPKKAAEPAKSAKTRSGIAPNPYP